MQALGRAPLSMQRPGVVRDCRGVWLLEVKAHMHVYREESLMDAGIYSFRPCLMMLLLTVGIWADSDARRTSSDLCSANFRIEI